MRFRERQLDAQCLSADLKNRTRPVPSPFSSREAVASEKVIQDAKDAEQRVESRVSGEAKAGPPWRVSAAILE